jgi:hypothetical protein
MTGFRHSDFTLRADRTIDAAARLLSLRLLLRR